MSRLSTAALLLLSLLIFGSARAQQIARTDPHRPETTEAFRPNIAPSLEIRRASGAITIDGNLDDPGWRGAARADNFTETYPRDMVRPPVATEAYIAYDDRNLYVAFVAHDDPETIRASMHDRDEQWNEDYCGLKLDTYGNGAWAYEIFVNALGVQGDVLMATNADEDTRFDIVFDSRAVVTGDGYRVEMAIPFSSLRFPDRAAQTWRGTFWRIHPRASRMQYSWAAISQDDPCAICQFGTWTGIENVHPGGALELLPAAVASKSATRTDATDPASPLAYGPVVTNLSLGARYAFTPSLTAEATFNPDFSQVESDAAQIDVNSTFALFYPEHRPFFQEGSDLFNGWINAVYTRSINSPKVAAKLIGRLGNTSVAYLGALDEQSPIIIPDEEASYFVQGGRSLSTIARVRHAFDGGSFIGGLVTDRRFAGGGSGSLVSVDGLYRILDNYQFEFHGALSMTREPDDPALTADLDGLTFDRGRHTIAFDGERYVGEGIYASFERHARDWTFDFDYTDRSPTFRAFNGFETEANRRMGNLTAGYSFYPESDLMDSYQPAITIGRVWNYDGLRKDEWVNPEIDLNLTAQTWLRLAYLYSNERFKGRDMDGIKRVEVNVNSNFSEPVSLGMDLSAGRFIARSLDVPVLGRGFDLNLFGTLRLFERLKIEPSIEYARLSYPDTGGAIFDGFIARANFNYQWTHELFLRLVVQYDQFAEEISIEPLLTYKLNPFTIFYAGSSHALDDRDGIGPFNGYLSTQQFFVKGQYLWQI
jgi:hypothetical protein